MKLRHHNVEMQVTWRTETLTPSWAPSWRSAATASCAILVVPAQSSPWTTSISVSTVWSGGATQLSSVNPQNHKMHYSGYRFKPLSLGVFCYEARDNQNMASLGRDEPSACDFKASSLFIRVITMVQFFPPRIEMTWILWYLKTKNKILKEKLEKANLKYTQFW